MTEAYFAVVLATIRHQALSDLDQDGSDGLFGSWAVPVTTQLYTHVSIQKLKAIHDATHPGAKLKPAASRAADVKTEAEHAAPLQASETRNRKPMRPNPIAPQELRVGQLRVYDEVSDDPGAGRDGARHRDQGGNKVRIGDEWWEPGKPQPEKGHEDCGDDTGDR